MTNICRKKMVTFSGLTATKESGVEATPSVDIHV